MPTINRTSAFTPALGRIPTRFYDVALRIFTRERTWRSLVLDMVAGFHPTAVLDVGSGTGTLAIAMSRRLPDAIVTGLDPDPEALMIAMHKAIRAGRRVQWHRGFAADAAEGGRANRFDVVTCTLVLHQVPLADKVSGLSAMRTALRPGGQLVLADYSEQRSWLMRTPFRLTVQRINGKRDTQPNADGILPCLLAEVGFADVTEIRSIATPSGCISIFTARRPS